MTQIVAFDEAENKFTKEVTITDGHNQKWDKYGYYGKILNFGWPCEYYINSLLRSYPFDTNLCIDAGGRNHYGHAVYVSKKDVNRLLKPFMEELLKPGTQILYVPSHADELDHSDVEKGFITSIVNITAAGRKLGVFCRYWSKHHSGLRTTANSEFTLLENIVVKDTYSQAKVDETLKHIMEEQK